MVMFVFVELKNTLYVCRCVGLCLTPLTKQKTTMQSRRYAENPRDAAVFGGLRPSQWFFRKSQKPVFYIRSMGLCVPNFRSVLIPRCYQLTSPDFWFFFFLRSSQVRHICLHLRENGWAASWNPVRFQIAFLWKRKGWVRPDPLEEPNFRFSFFSDERERQGHSTTTLRVVF